jgi:hypothetical protein
VKKGSKPYMQSSKILDSMKEMIEKALQTRTRLDVLESIRKTINIPTQSYYDWCKRNFGAADYSRANSLSFKKRVKKMVSEETKVVLRKELEQIDAKIKGQEKVIDQYKVGLAEIKKEKTKIVNMLKK